MKQHKKINEGPIAPKKGTTPETPKPAPSSKSWMVPATSMIDTAKTKFSTPVDKMDQGMPGGRDPGLAQGKVGSTVIVGGFLLGLLAVGATGLAVLRRIRNKKNSLLGKTLKSVEQNPAMLAKAEREFASNTEKLMKLVDDSISANKISSKLAKAIKTDPEAEFAYLYRTKQMSKDQYDALITVIRSSGEARLELIKLNTKIAYNNYKTGKWTWDQASLWLEHLDDVRPGYVKRLKDEADKVRGIKKGSKPSAIPSAKSSVALETWRNTPAGKALAPIGKPLIKYMPKAKNLATFERNASTHTKDAAAFFGMTSQEYRKVLRTDWFKTTGFPRYQKYLRDHTRELPATFKNLTEFPSFSEWENTIKIFNLHKNLWMTPASMKSQYLTDRFLWRMSK